MSDNTSYFDLYKALKADGAVQGDWGSFHKFVGAPGKQGYLNRKKLYDALKADGAVQSNTYEEFNMKLFRGGQARLKAAKQRQAANSQTQQQKPAENKAMTTAQRAMQVAQEYQQAQQPVDYLHRPQNQMGRQQRNAPKNASPFVQSLNEVDNAKRGADYPVSYSSPKGVQQVYQQNQQVRKQAAKTAADHIANDEYRRQSQPMIDNGTMGVMKPMGEIEQEMSDSASKFVDANLGDYINKAVLGEQNAAAQRGLDAANRVPLQAGTGGMGLMVKGMAYNEQVDPDLMAKNLTDNARDGFLKLFQDPNFVAKVENEATRLGVTPEAYMESIIPHLKDRLATSLQESEYQKALPKNMLDNIANRFIDSNTIGKALRLATQTRGQRILNEQASAATAEGKNPYYKGGTVENVAADVAGMVTDPIFGTSAKLGGAVAGKLIGNSTKIGALMANGNLAQRLTLQGTQAITSGGVTGFVFDATGGVIQNYSTGEDTSLGNTLKVAAKRGVSGAVNFSTMSLAGLPLANLGRSVGLKLNPDKLMTWGNAGRATAKLGLEAGKTYMEAMGMYLGGYASGKLEGQTDANGKPIQFDLWNGTMESLPTAIGFRIQHTIEGMRGGRKNAKGEDMGWLSSTLANFKDFLTSDKAKASPYLLTNEEKHQIFSSGANLGLKSNGENIVDYAKRTKSYKPTERELSEDGSDLLNYYQQIVNDPNVSWDAKSKFSALVMGIMPSARPMMDYIRIGTEEGTDNDNSIHSYKTISEYASDGTLLSKRRYDTRDQRESIIYGINMRRENLRLHNVMGLLAMQDRNNYEFQNAFFKEHAKDWEQVQEILDGMKTEGSAIDHDFTSYVLNAENGHTMQAITAVAEQNGMERQDLIKALNKDPFKRTDVEQNACVQLRRAFEKAAFPPNKVHPEQSQLEGKDVAEENNLGSEQPNPQPVMDELRNLRAAEQALEQAMDGNDVFKQVFEQCQKQGIRPVDAYDVLIQNGLTQEEIAPLADYINANARVQGMQTATQQATEEHVGARVSDWSYKGSLNGGNEIPMGMDASKMLYVNWNGKTYIVGNGDVSFDSTGRAKEDVGDMLVCLDPETNTMEYIPTREVTFGGTESANDYAAKYRQQLQMINSQPYNAAAQEQAMQDAANSEKKVASPENGGENTGPESVPQNAPQNNASPENQEVKSPQAPVQDEQPQQVRKFADGTDVPMTKDSKGRPTPDYGSMKPEQAAEILTQDFGENAEKVVDGQVKKAEKALKDAENMKVDYSAEPNDILEQEQVKAQTIEAAKQQLEQAQNIKKAMTAKMVAETVAKPSESEKVDEANQASPIVREKFDGSKKVAGRRGSITLPGGKKIRGTYYYGETSGLTPSHDPFSDFKQNEGFPVNEDGTTANSRSYKDKGARQFTEQIGNNFNGLALKNVPVVQDGVVLSGNGTTMAKLLAERNGKDGQYREDLNDNIEGFGLTPEKIAEVGDKGIVYFVPDEKFPLSSKTFDMFNKRETKSESNTEQAVAKAKTLTADEVGAIVADIEGNGSLDAFFNNSKAINDLVRTLVDKGIIGQNEVDGFMDGTERLSAQGKEYVKNLLLGSVFKPETIRMLGIDGKIKNAAINGIRAIMDNLKLGDYSLRDELDQAIQLLYEARRSKMSVEDLLRQNSAFDENARDRFSMIAQAMAQALEGKTSTFRELMNEYNDIAKNYNTSEGTLDFYDKLTPEQLVDEFLNASKAIKNNNIKLYGKDSETESGNDAASNEEPAKEAGGAVGTEGNEPAATRNGEWFDQSVEKLKTAKEEERKQILDDMAEYVKGFAKKNGYAEPEVYKTKEELLAAAKSPSERKNIENVLKFNGNYPAYYEDGKIHIYLESTKNAKDLARSFAHEYVHKDNEDDPSRVNMLVYSVENGDIKQTDLEDAIERVCGSKLYRNEAARLKTFGEDPIPMLADEVLAHIVQEIYAEGEDVVSQITANPTLQKIALDAYKFRENERRSKEQLSENRNQEPKRTQVTDGRTGGSVRPVSEDSNAKSENAAGRGSESGVRGLREADEDKPNSVGFTPKQIREHQASVDEMREAYIKALQDGKSEKEVEDAAMKYEFAFKDHQNMMGIMDEASVEDLWKKELEAAKASVPVPVMPKPVEPSNPIEKAAEDYKKEHPLTEEELLNTTAFDDLPEDQKQYCIDAALDYLNGEDNSAIAEAYYRNAYEKRSVPSEGNKLPKPEQKNAQAEQKPLSSDPMEGLKNAAEGYEETKKAKSATERVKEILQTPRGQKPKTTSRKELEAERDAADNEFEAFMKELRKKRSGQLNSGFIDQNLVEAAPKMFSLAAKCAYTRIKLGMYDAKEVVKDLRERFKEAFDGFDKRDIETFYSQIMEQKWRDGDKRMSLNGWAEHYRKLSPEYKEKLEGDSKDAEERKQNEASFIGKMRTRIIFSTPVKSITEMRKIAESCGLKDVKDTDLQELAETAVSSLCREVCESKAMSDEVKFRKIKHIYDNQPSLNQRDSERVMKQQYSTPAPYAFLADMYVKGNGKEVKSALEPSAGNGMLTIGLPMDAVHVNDIDAQRLANLRRQGFKNVTSQDGTQPFADKDVDVVVTNPPFGSATPKEYDGYKIGSLEGQMAINALESMKDDGRAAIIIGGKTEYAKNGSLNPKDKAFLGYLYSHYNVEDVINVDGSLYAKQGTTYPTRIILINGRRLDENVFPPVKSKARAEAVKDYDELYKRISDDILRGERMDSSIKEGEGNARPELDRPSSADTHEEGVRAGGERGGEPSDKRGAEQSGEPSVSGADDVLENRPTADREPDGGLSGGDNSTDRTGTEPSQSEGTEARTNDGRVSEQGGAGRVDSEPSNDRPSASNRSGERPRGQLQRMDESVRGLSTEKVTYTPKSGNPFTLKAVMPSDQQEAVNKNLEKLGDADQFLVDELGYNDKDDLYSHLAAEQVDSVALALQQAKKGNAFIIGDMTGIGKGRQAASLIRYAKKQDQVPVYFTKTAGLLSDVYRDLVDIGSPELRPFVFGSAKEAAITDADGKVVFPLPPKNEVKRVLDYIEKNGELPKEYDYVLTTYSQVSNGIYEFDENGNRKERKIGKNKSFGAAAFSGQRRRDAIEKLMANGYLILDESHTAGGNSGQGNYFQHIIQKAKNVTFFSATFAKRPDNMPIYALRTAMNQGGLKASELIDAVKRGGATLQEIMSQTLTQCGQMIRRERDMTGVTIDWRAIDELEKVKEQREQYDSIIGLFNDIINFQKTYVSHYVEDQNEAMAAMQASMGIKRGTEALGIKNVPFASKAFNTVQQVLLSLKAKSAAERAIDYLKQGMKPVIALNNTNESQTGNIALGEEMDAPDLGTSLRKGLEGTLRYTSKNAKDESSSGYIKLEDLGDDAVEAYHNLEKKIKETSTGLSLSPIDVIKNELEKAGYKVGELTGRSTEFVYNDNGTVTKVKRADTDKKKLAREFNDGQIDALILNKSAATGISLHASSKYKDQRKRVMIVAQQQLDVNDEVQMRGRIDRTGQVARGAYEYVVSLIPAEQRLLMMFKAKLKSLDANTTSSQKSKFNEMEVADITNKYGDKVVREYMAEHLDLYSRMADPFGWEKEFGDDLSSISTQNLVVTKSGLGDGEAGADASKLLGRMALLKVEEQEKMLNEIGELYANEIQRLNEMGENDLEITELPLKAKTIRKEVWKQGSEPGGDNAFADNTYIEKVNMAILKKPMKAEEVKKAQDGLTGGKSWDEYRESKKAEVKNFFDQKIADETQKYEERAVKAATKTKEKYQKDAKKGQKDSGMSDEQIEKMAGYQYDNIYKQEKEKLNDVVKNLKAKAEMFDRVLDTFNTEDAYVLPVDMNKPDELSGFGNSYGRLIDIKITDNFSPNASSVSFATLDGRRKITFPIAGKVGSGDSKADVIGAIYRMTRQASGTGDKQLRVLSMDVNNWDRLVSNESRKDGYIVTGNLMQALIDSKNQGVGGQLVKYTTDTGEVKTGILMPDRFKPTDVANEYPISTKADALEKPSFDGGVEEVVSSDGDIKVTYKHDIYTGRTHYELRVPKSKAKGGKFFLDKDLLSMVNGNNFESRGNSMLGILNPDQLRPALARLSNLGVKVREERKSSEDGTHYRTANGEQGNDAQSIVANHIANVSEKVGGKVNMVNSVDEITNPRVKADIESGKNVTGWYDEKTGEVHLYMPNIHDRYTAEKTIWHEVVGHKGMRELLGEDGFRKFIREVWDNLDKPEYASLKKLVDEERRYNPFGIEDAIEEGIARLAEEGRGDAGLWNSIKNKVSDFLHEIGYRLAPNTKDVKYLLWLSKNLQKNPNDPYYKMRAEAVKYRLDHEDISAVTEHDGMFHDNDGRIYKGLGDLPKAEYQEATDGQIHFRTTPSAGTALDRYHRSLDAHGYMFTESYMDSMLSLKNLMTAIVPGVKIEDIASSENPYILQNTMQGAMNDAAQMFERNVMKPLDKAMAQVLDAFEGKKDDEKIRNFNLYMITKHGLERNRVFFVRDFLRKMRMDEQKKQDADFLESSFYSDKEYLDNELKAGNIDLKEYYRQMDESIRNHLDADFEAGEHDYSGIHAIQEVAKSSDPYDDAEAIQSVMDSEAKMESIKKGSVKDYWDKVKAATQYSIDSDYKNGIISKELYGHVSNMFNWYVPLRKYDEATAEDTYGYITEQGDPKSYIGSTIMRARGHKYLSETNVLAQIGAMGNRAIKNGGMNAIRQAFARFARNNSGNNLITETSVWYEKDPVVNIVYERYPDIPEDATADEINQIVSDFNKDMKMKESQGLAYKVYRRGSIGYKFQRAENKSQHIVDVMIAGKKHSFIVNGNPRAAQALNGLLEHKNETGIGKIAGKISRFMAQTCTSYNPEFVMRNMMRDFEFASSNLLAKEGARYTGVFEKYYAKVGIIEGIRNSKLSDFKDTGGFGLFAKYRNGTLDTSDKIQRYFKEFMENGGETGWVQIKDMKEWTEEYKRNIKAERNKASKIGKGFYNVIFKNLENVNEIAENMARFATYCASRDYGRSVVRSTYDAKEVSTNFNRHGSGSEIKSFKNGEMGGFQNFRKNTYRFTSAWFRNTSMFFNAGIQSTNLLVKNLKNNTAGTLGYIASGPMISGMAMALLNNFLIANEDEKDRKGVKDPYGELPDYIRRNNLCVYVGGGEFVTIPLAIEERAFYGLGDLAAGLTFSPNVSGQKNPFLDAVGCMSQLVPVADYLGNASFGKHPVQETVKAVMPSATSPFIEWAYNSDWKGAPIERDNKFDENQPAWMLAYKGTPDFLISLNKKANAYTNDVAKGNEDMKGNDFLDALTNPSGLQHFYSGYLGGAATFAERSLGLIKHGKDAETKDIPFVRSIIYTPSEQSSLQRTKSKWYNYKDEMETTIANVDRLKSKNVPIDKRIANIGDYYNFQNSKDAAKVRVIELAEKQMKQWKKLRDKSGDTESIKFANENIDRIMMEAVEQLDKLN